MSPVKAKNTAPKDHFPNLGTCPPSPPGLGFSYTIVPCLSNRCEGVDRGVVFETVERGVLDAPDLLDRGAPNPRGVAAGVVVVLTRGDVCSMPCDAMPAIVMDCEAPRETLRLLGSPLLWLVPLRPDRGGVWFPPCDLLPLRGVPALSGEADAICVLPLLCPFPFAIGSTRPCALGVMERDLLGGCPRGVTDLDGVCEREGSSFAFGWTLVWCPMDVAKSWMCGTAYCDTCLSAACQLKLWKSSGFVVWSVWVPLFFCLCFIKNTATPTKTTKPKIGA